MIPPKTIHVRNDSRLHIVPTPHTTKTCMASLLGEIMLVPVFREHTRTCIHTPCMVVPTSRELARQCVNTLYMKVKRISNTDQRELCCCETFKSFLNHLKRMITHQWASTNIETLRTYENDPEQVLIRP